MNQEQLTDNEEPSIGEVINDPIVKMLMKKDGVKRESLMPILAQIAQEMDAKAS